MEENVSLPPVDTFAGRLDRLRKLAAENDQLFAFLERIELRRRELGLSERRTAMEARLSPSQIRTMRRQIHEGKQRGVSNRAIGGLAEALRTTPEWLILGTGPKELENEDVSEGPKVGKATASLPLVGAVGAGLWLEAASEYDKTRLATAAADPRYPAEHQSAYEVRGTSIDLIARPGDFLIVFDRVAAGASLRSGDIVIVTQIKKGLREITARRFRTRTTAPGCELTFESADPKYNFGVWLPRQDSTESYTLSGIVVGVYRPLA